MLRNHLTLAWRTLRRQPGYTLLNVGGLAVGMAACLVIGLYVADELSYDAFHERGDRIMAVTMKGSSIENRTTPWPLAEALVEDLPEVEAAVRTTQQGGARPVRRADGSFEREQRVLMADAAFFEVFSFPLVQGDASTALDAPQQAVITEPMAQTFFGDADPLGQTLAFEQGGETYSVTVAGVARDVPHHATLQFDMVVPLALRPPSEDQRGWGLFNWHTYALLDRSMDADAFGKKVRALQEAHTDNTVMALGAVALPDLYLSDYYDADGFGGQRRYVYLFGTVALLILLIAAINYVNLVTAQGETRAREVGVRRSMGAQREQLAAQFLGETALLSMLAVVAALVLVSVALPGFNALLGTELALADVRTGRALPVLVAFVLAVSVAAGAYPAFVLSRYRPTEVLRGRGGTGGAGGSWLRRGLVIFQFAVSAGLILCTAAVYQQLRFVQTQHLGFDGEQVVAVDLQAGEEQLATIKREVLRLPGVERASVADAAPGGFRVQFSVEPGGIASGEQTEREQISMLPARVDADYVETMGLQLVAGRSFSAERPSDRTHAYVLNRAAAEAMGWTSETAVGQPFLFGREGPEGEVIGVVENFHVESLRDPIDPVVLQMEAESFSSGGVLAARLAPEQIGAAMEGIERVLAEQLPEATFEFTFLDDTFDAMYRSEERIAQMFMAFAVLAMMIACLGLFGLAAFAAERRTKEIAVRKALGASTRSIVGLLSKEFAALVLVALVVGVPIAYWGVDQWLTEFAYRADVGPGLFVLTAAVALGIAGAATSYHALHAAWTNPALALRDE